MTWSPNIPSYEIFLNSTVGRASAYLSKRDESTLEIILRFGFCSWLVESDVGVIDPFYCSVDLKLEGALDAALLSIERLFSIVSLIFLARVDLPIPGRPTGTKNSLLTVRMSSVETRLTRNFKSAS